VTEPDIADRIHKFYDEVAIPAESFARAVAFAMSQPEDVDVNEILFRTTHQELYAHPLPRDDHASVKARLQAA
jgi:NADP-dependent 3-hydroxy acid dehydrogenase YdfG